jgi:hypothetical protein
MFMFYITHIDAHGEHHQIGDAFEAATPEDALYAILKMSGAEDDGNYVVWSKPPPAAR